MHRNNRGVTRTSDRRSLAGLLAFLFSLSIMWAGACTAPQPATEQSPQDADQEGVTREQTRSEHVEGMAEASDAAATEGTKEVGAESSPQEKPVVDLQERGEEGTTSDAGSEPDGPQDAGQEPLPEGMNERPPDGSKAQQCNNTSYTHRFGQDDVTVRCQQGSGGLRSYTLTTTHALRDNLPASKQRKIAEKADTPRVRSGNLLFDALYAMAIAEVAQNAVANIQEGAFQNNQPIACACFQTGEKWTWAWTRDTAYSVDLALAALEPTRSKNTLLFKLSAQKQSLSGGKPQLIQDTGTGGSWPVSSDRVVWAMAAWKLHHFLQPNERSAFLQQIYPALQNTLEHDRKRLFDAQGDGLYRGEQSFLDWREQSYPIWTKDALAHIAMSKALSTNINHLVAIEFTANIADTLSKTADATRYKAWATALRKAILQGFQLPDTPLLSTMRTTSMDLSATYQFDLLGNALAILTKVADTSLGAKIVAAYPHTEAGAPVLWPQQPFIPIYHNRAIWPFVSAYWARAAHQTNNANVTQHNIRTLYRSAALNLSNMENFEFQTGKNWHQDGNYSGPIVNSRRQLWSVAGYLSVIQDILFGLSVQADGIRFLPFVPRSLHEDWFPQPSLTLHNFPYLGKRIDITIKLPTQSAARTGAYKLQSLQLNGKTINTDFLKPGQLQAQNTLVATLSPQVIAEGKRKSVPSQSSDFRVYWSPKTPRISRIEEKNGALHITVDSNGESGVQHNIYRDGQKVASNVQTGTWVDNNVGDRSKQTYCYSADSVYPTTNNRSHHAPPTCWIPPDHREKLLNAWRFEATGGQWANQVQGHYKDWGAPGHTLQIAALRPHWSGEHWLQLQYRNPHGSTNTGITCATKRVQFFDKATGSLEASALIIMPHTILQDPAPSTLAKVTLDATKTYRVLIDDPPELNNMSYLAHFAAYTGGKGGGNDPFNQAEIFGLRLLAHKGTAAQNVNTGNTIPFNGINDLDKLPTSQIVNTGVSLETWARFGMTWDNEWLYIAVVTKGFELPLRAFVLYIQASKGTLPATATSTGMTYLQLTPQLPFSPTHAIGLRQKPDNNDGFGPWNGIWRLDQTQWHLQTRLQPSKDTFLSGDKHTLSTRLHRAELGWPTHIRIAGHLVYAQSNNEWKVTVPANHTPWQKTTSGYYEINLNAQPASTNWTNK